MSLHVLGCAVKKVLLGLVMCVSCVVAGGCGFYVYPKNSSCECKQWIRDAVENKFNPMSADAIVRAFPLMKDRYEYYICLNRFFHPQYLFSDIFSPDAQQAALYAASMLDKSNNDQELYFTIHILYGLQKHYGYNVASDEKIMSEISKAYGRIQSETDRYIVGTWVNYMYSSRQVK